MRSPQVFAGGAGDLLADLGAGDVPSCAILQQRRARLVDERLHLLDLAIEHLGHLQVAEATDLGEHESFPLALGKVLKVGDKLLELGTLLDLVRETLEGRPVEVADGLILAVSQHRERAVARDRVEPCLELGRVLVARQGAEGRAEGVLDASSASSREPSMWRQKVSSWRW